MNINLDDMEKAVKNLKKHVSDQTGCSINNIEIHIDADNNITIIPIPASSYGYIDYAYRGWMRIDD